MQLQIKKPVDRATLNNFFWSKHRYNWRQYGMPAAHSDEPLILLAYERLEKQRAQVIKRRRRGRTKAAQKWETLLKPQAVADCYKVGYIRNNKAFDGDECLFFPSMIPYRPETVRYNFKTMAASRAMLLVAHGLPTGDGTMALHKCGNGHLSCVNPKHLYWGTAKDNARDRVVHNAPSQFMAGMDRADVDKIRYDERLARVISWETGVPANVVALIKTGEIFKPE